MTKDLFHCDTSDEHKKCIVKFKPCEIAKQVDVKIDMSTCDCLGPVPPCPLPWEECHDKHHHRRHHRHHRKHRHRRHHRHHEEGSKACNNNSLIILLIAVIIKYCGFKWGRG